ncbi:MAG: response regulator [Candidatus Saccharimonas sp.]
MVKILLVEDDKSLREIYGVRLLAEGYDIVSAGDGEEALAMAIKDRPDLIVSDVMMPKISGFDMLDILRSTTETKDIKVIMMTALSSEEQRQRGVALGADRYLVKSQVGIEDVVRTVHEVLGDAPVVATPAPQPAPITPAPLTPMAPTPVAAPTPVVTAPIVPMPTPTPTPIPVAIAQPVEPTPVTPPLSPLPVPTTVSTVDLPGSEQPVLIDTAPAPTLSPVQPVLPQPTAPFSTPRTTGNTLADRVIQPLNKPDDTPDFAHLINQELGHPPVAAPASNMNYEETPRLDTPPSLPIPPQPPTPGV